jgi:hypothetical protein
MLEEEGAGASMMFAARRLPNNGLTAWADALVGQP